MASLVANTRESCAPDILRSAAFDGGRFFAMPIRRGRETQRMRLLAGFGDGPPCATAGSRKSVPSGDGRRAAIVVLVYAQQAGRHAIASAQHFSRPAADARYQSTAYAELLPAATQEAPRTFLPSQEKRRFSPFGTDCPMPRRAALPPQRSDAKC